MREMWEPYIYFNNNNNYNNNVAGLVILLSILFVISWNMHVRKTSLDLNIFSHRLQRNDTPSKWLASICYFILVDGPSFPQGLQILARFCRISSWIMFSLISIIVLTVSSSSCKSADIIEVLGWELAHCSLFCCLVLYCLENHSLEDRAFRPFQN